MVNHPERGDDDAIDPEKVAEQNIEDVFDFFIVVLYSILRSHPGDRGSGRGSWTPAAGGSSHCRASGSVRSVVV